MKRSETTPQESLDNPNPLVNMGPNNGSVIFNDDPLQQSYPLSIDFAVNSLRQYYKDDPQKTHLKIAQLRDTLTLELSPGMDRDDFMATYRLLKGIEDFMHEFWGDIPPTPTPSHQRA